MIVLIYGTGSNLPTQIWLAILGYIVGMETAMGSFVCGKSVARFLHRKVNPVLALEAHAVQDRKEEGVYIHWELPDFERRFLALIDVADEQAHFNLSKSVEYLETWRRSTVDARRVRHYLLPHLNAIEEAVLIHHEAIPSESEAVAREQGWEVDALLHWAMDDEHGEPTKRHSSFLNPDSSRPNEVSRWLTLPVAAFLFWTVMFGLFTALILLKEEEDTVVTYRTMAYAMFLAPFGALCRWKLSEFNGKLPNYSWFPFGTFLANISGSILSILAVSIEYYMDTKMFYPGKFNFWGIGTIRATRIGFAGCLTTVSTFVSEIHGFMQAHTDTAYPYIMTTISVACAIGSIIYGIVVYAI